MNSPRQPLETRIYSPAGILKAILRQMGVEPILQRQPDFPAEVLGHAMTAFYGGRAECRIRRVPVPVTYVDFLSMYPTVMSLIGIWGLVIAKRIDIVEDTDRGGALVERVTLDDCFHPSLWSSLMALVEIEPDGDVLPVRADYAGSGEWQIGINEVTSAQPMWYALADVIASKLLSGHTPRIRRVLRMMPDGQQQGLTPIALRGQVEIDPRTGDLFRRLIEERGRLRSRTDLDPPEATRLDSFLKVLANSGYGTFAEMRRRELPRTAKEQVHAYGLDCPFVARVNAVEEPGPFCFPPAAACITAGARLMLALLERSVTDLGGTYAFCDTDSMAIVSSQEGGLVACARGPLTMPDGAAAIKALRFHEIEQIRDRFAALSPYDRTAVTDTILKLEKENYHEPRSRERREQLWCDAISAKRYALFNRFPDGTVRLRKPSEHGLGHLLNPIDPQVEDRDWIRQLWMLILGEDLGIEVSEPEWLDRMACSRTTVSSAHVLRAFASYNQSRVYADQIKPFNFLLGAHLAHFGHPIGFTPRERPRFHLIALWESDPRKWPGLEWTDVYSGERFRVTASAVADFDGVARVKTYRDVLAEYRLHPEHKSKALGDD